jgi:hypothetical protein
MTVGVFRATSVVLVASSLHSEIQFFLYLNPTKTTAVDAAATIPIHADSGCLDLAIVLTVIVVIMPTNVSSIRFLTLIRTFNLLS